MKIKLPQVHIAVNVAGILTTLGSIAAFVVANPNAPAAFGAPTKDTAAILALAGLLATLLPDKRGAAQTPAPKS